MPELVQIDHPTDGVARLTLSRPDQMTDLRYGAESATYGTAFIRLGLPGCDKGVSWLLPRLIGASRAWELNLTGRVIDSADADRLGLVGHTVPDDEPMDTWMTNEVRWSNLEIPSLAAGIDIESRNQIVTSLTENSREAMQSFLARRPVHWKNR